MKFYNPFKPHIVKNGHGQYLVRKFQLNFDMLGWTYIAEGWYWTQNIVYKRTYSSYEAAQADMKLKLEHEATAQLNEELRDKEKVVHGKPE